MNKNSQIVPGMRPWKSKEGRPLVNPEGKPAAYSGFLLGVAEAPNEAGAAGRWGRCASCWRAGPSLDESLNGANNCSEDEGGVKEEDGTRCPMEFGGSKRSGRSTCSGRGRFTAAEGAGGRKACWRGTPPGVPCCLPRDPALKSTWRFWLKFLCGTTGTWMGFPAALLLLPSSKTQNKPIRR